MSTVMYARELESLPTAGWPPLADEARAAWASLDEVELAVAGFLVLVHLVVVCRCCCRRRPRAPAAKLKHL